ncbi:MAG: flagellar hook-length control protein FliK [Hyphomicrobiales bacterium]|nr:flagellar hook-length control protein FliK [Hyphomicrobiales bacterium]MBV8824809.1 flagellar hook-length control protein FliK [Hyphomicrobiales bacterium]MBV9430057.1 flagellar hook-length control protein FliK [Bradyrhizobiaceae bacterium]
MASVAADTSAIAPPPPLPSRPDAGPPAGPAGAFADLLDASAAPTTAPQPQGPPGARMDDGSSAAQTNAAAGSGPSGTAPASAGAATASTRNSKDPASSKSGDDRTDDGTSGGNPADLTVVTGLPLPPFAFAPLPSANQTPAPSPDTPTASVDPVTPTQDGTSAPPADRKGSDAPSDSIAAGLAAALPVLVPVVPVVAPTSSALAGNGPVAALQSAPTAGVISSRPSAGGPATGSDEADIAALPAQQPDGTGQSSRPASNSILDLLTAMPSATATLPGADSLQTGDLPGLTSAAANNAAPDRNAPSAPATPALITANAPSGTGTPAAVAAALNPPAGVPSAAQIQLAAETSNTSPRDAGAAPVALPPQVAVRFAAPAHTDADASSDDGTDVLRGGSIGATAPTESGQPGAAITPAFTGILSTLQAAPGAPTAPQHAAVTTDAVTLAAVPIAIVARAEAGERKFEIRLDPPDLGRIDVQLNVDSSGRATSHLVVDRAATLDLLRRDAPALERALQSAGLTTDSGSLQFSLRDQSFAGRDQGTPAPLAAPAPVAAVESDSAPLDTALRRYSAAAGLGGGIDIRV